MACEAQRSAVWGYETMVDESCFGARRVKGRRGRGAYGKTVVFGIFERQGRRLYRDRPGLLKAHPRRFSFVSVGRVDPRTVINADGWRGYHGLVDLG